MKTCIDSSYYLFCMSFSIFWCRPDRHTTPISFLQRTQQFSPAMRRISCLLITPAFSFCIPYHFFNFLIRMFVPFHQFRSLCKYRMVVDICQLLPIPLINCKNSVTNLLISLFQAPLRSLASLYPSNQGQDLPRIRNCFLSKTKCFCYHADYLIMINHVSSIGKMPSVFYLWQSI